MVLTALALTGCTVEPGGVVGLSVDADGRTMAVVAVCDEDAYLDGLALYADDAEDTEDPLGQWVRSEAITRTAELVLARPGPQWTAEHSLALLPPSSRLKIYAWTSKNRWSADGPNFIAADLARLHPDQVWFERYDESSETFVNTFVNADDFSADACKNLF